MTLNTCRVPTFLFMGPVQYVYVNVWWYTIPIKQALDTQTEAIRSLYSSNDGSALRCLVMLLMIPTPPRVVTKDGLPDFIHGLLIVVIKWHNYCYSN